MKSSLISSAYIVSHSMLHRLHSVGKLTLLLTYVVLLTTWPTALSQIGFILLLSVVMLAIRLPLRHKVLALITVLLLITVVMGWLNSSLLRGLIMAFSQVVCLMMLVSLFGMITKPTDLFTMGSGTWFHTIAFGASLTLAVLPGIQYDLQRSLDTETLRRGRPIGLLAFGAWLGLLPQVLIRALARADRLAETVLERGYVLDRGLVPLHCTTFGWSDLVLTLLGMLPALLLWTLK